MQIADITMIDITMIDECMYATRILSEYYQPLRNLLMFQAQRI